MIAEQPPIARVTEGTSGEPGGTGLVRHPLPVVVAASAAAMLAITSYPAPGRGAIAALLAAVVVVLAATDLERRVIPNRIVLPAAVVILAANILVAPSRTPEFLLAALGAGMVFLIPNLISVSLMGMGDVKLAVLLGAGLGWGVVGAVVVAYMATLPVAIVVLLRGGLAARKSTLPFGPFLALGALVILIVPPLVGLGAG